MAGDLRRPPFDPELRAGLAVIGGVFPPTITPDLISFMRRSYASPPLEEILARFPDVECTHETVAGHNGDPIEVSVFRAAGASGARPAVVYAHSGGLMFGDRFNALDLSLMWVRLFGVILITFDYRLAPEFPDPYAREDTYAVLEWAARDAGRLKLDRHRVLIGGASAGGGLAAGVALAARDRGGPSLRGQLLLYPMLDDRGVAPSVGQFDGVGVWDRVSNETGWKAYLGPAYRTDDVSEYAVPARATDLSGLPSTYLDAGSAEIFRDETVDYATRLWQAGTDAELHVWAGGFHGFDLFAPHAMLSQGMIATRNAWIERVLAD